MTDKTIQWGQIQQLIEQGRGSEVVPHLHKYLREVPEDVNAHIALGLAAWKEGDVRTANEWLRRAVTTDPHHVTALQIFNKLRIRHHDQLPEDRPKVLCTAYGGRIAGAVISVADAIFLMPGPQLGRRDELVCYNPKCHKIDEVLSQLPNGWQPDYVLFHLIEVSSLPLGIEDCPAVTVGIPGDPLHLQKLSIDMEFFDVFLPGVRRFTDVFQALGHPQVVYGGGGGVQGLIPDLDGLASPVDGDRPYDVLFIGNVGQPFYSGRTRFVHRLLRLGDRYNVFASTKQFTREEYYRLMGQAKIVIETPSVQGGVNMRAFEAVQFGALLMHEELDRSIEEFFRDREEVVLFRDDNFEELIEYYITHEEERQRIVRQAQKRAAGRYTMHAMAVETIRVLSEADVKPIVKKAVQDWPDHVKRNHLAFSDFQAGEYRRALTLLEEAIQLNPNSAEYLNNLGVTCFALWIKQEDPAFREQAHEWLGRSLRLNPRYWVARYNLLRIAEEAKLDGLVPVAKELVVELNDFVVSPREGDFDNLRGLWIFPELIRNRCQAASPYEAIAWEKAVELHPDRGEGYFVELATILLWRTLELYAGAMARAGQPREAVEALFEALSLNTEHAGLWRQVGEQLLQLEETEKALEAFQNSLSLLPLNVDTELGLVRALMRLGKHDEARKRVDEFVRTNICEPERNEELLALVNEEERPSSSPQSGANSSSSPPSRQFDPAQVIENFEKAYPGDPKLQHPMWKEFRNDFVSYFRHFEDSSEAREFHNFLLRPILDGKTPNTDIDKFYFYQDTWASRKIFEIRPSSVVDVGSTALYAGIISQFVPTTFVDIRPIDVNLRGLTVQRASILDLPFEDDSQEFVTSLCVVEHIGLGRYGDPIKPDGTRMACRELVRIVRPGGRLVISVPAGPPAIVFNAHRIFAKEQILSYFPGFRVEEEIFLFPEPGPESMLRRLEPGQFAFYVFMLRKEP